MGRKKVYASEAERLAAYRSRKARIDVTVKPETAQTLDRIAATLDVSKNALCADMIRFALTNRNWALNGLMGKQ